MFELEGRRDLAREARSWARARSDQDQFVDGTGAGELDMRELNIGDRPGKPEDDITTKSRS